MKGLGIGSALVAFSYGSFTSAYFSWYAYYLFYSFSPVLPWSTCDNPWNTDHCFTPHSTSSASFNNATRINDTGHSYSQEGLLNHIRFQNVTDISAREYDVLNISLTNVNNKYMIFNNNSVKASSAEEFLRLRVLGLSAGVETLGGIRWPLVGWLILAVLCMYLILFRGVHVSGKLIRALTLPGATDGILYYIRPDFTKLKDFRIWLEACLFALYSMGTGKGCIITAASRNNFRSNCFSQSLILVLGDVFITIYCGFAIFTFLGHLAWVKGVPLGRWAPS